jgi:hypothetical protein
MPVSAPLPAPSHNAGAQAQGILLVAQALDQMRQAMSKLDPTSPIGLAVSRALNDIGKKVGAAPPETQVNSLQSQLIEAKRSAMQRQQLQQGGGAAAAAPGGGGAPPGPGAVPSAPAMAA